MFSCHDPVYFHHEKTHQALFFWIRSILLTVAGILVSGVLVRLSSDGSLGVWFTLDTCDVDLAVIAFQKEKTN